MGLTKYEALKILGLEDGSSEKEIRDRYKKLAMRWQPDKHFKNPDDAQKKFQAISAAYTRLITTEDQDYQRIITLGDIFTELKDHRRRGYRSYDPHAHLFCDCDICTRHWSGVEYTDVVGSDSDLDDYDDDSDDYFYGLREERLYGDHVLRQFADQLYKHYNGPSRVARRARMNAWEDSIYKKKFVSAEEAERNADELLMAEEKEKMQNEKRKQKNKKKREAKKKKKAKKRGDKDQDDKDSAKENSSPKNSTCSNHSKETNELKDKEHSVEEKSMAQDDYNESEDDSDFDVSSAFVARASKKKAQPSSAAAAAKPVKKSSSATKVFNGGTVTHNVKKDPQKENAVPNSSVTGTSNGHSSPKSSTVNTETEQDLTRSRHLAGLGNIAAKDGHFQEAVRRYTEAIELYPFDHRYFGNRSFCYDFLHDYLNALEDANKALSLDSNWPKGYYRQGRAYAGLKRFDEAEKAFENALKLDPAYKDSEDELVKIRMEQMKGMGFAPELCEAALRKFVTVQAAIDALLAGEVTRLDVDQRQPIYPQVEQDQQSTAYTQTAPVYNHSGYQIPPRLRDKQQHQQNLQQLPPQSEHRALWVGNINNSSITEEALWEIFNKYGAVSSVRVLVSRRCAFVNYEGPESAAEAMKGLQGYHIGGCYLVIRYPENAVKSVQGAATISGGMGPRGTTKKYGPVNGDECHFWRTTGCSYGQKCRYKHIPANKGVDRVLLGNSQ